MLLLHNQLTTNNSPQQMTTTAEHGKKNGGITSYRILNIYFQTAVFYYQILYWVVYFRPVWLVCWLWMCY